MFKKTEKSMVYYLSLILLLICSCAQKQCEKTPQPKAMEINSGAIYIATAQNDDSSRVSTNIASNGVCSEWYG